MVKVMALIITQELAAQLPKMSDEELGELDLTEIEVKDTEYSPDTAYFKFADLGLVMAVTPPTKAKPVAEVGVS